MLEFGVSDETAWEVGLACGGKVEVFVEAVAPAQGRGLPRELLDELLAARRAPRAALLATPLDGSAHHLLDADPRPRAARARRRRRARPSRATRPPSSTPPPARSSSSRNLPPSG